jgi:thymidine kinase
MPDVIMVDEAQFLTEQQVEDLAKIVDTMEIPVLCYGLLTDFKTRLFTGSKRLIELGAKMRELIGITSTGKRAVINAMIDKDKIVREGETIQIGGNEKYRAISRKAYMEDVID